MNNSLVYYPAVVSSNMSLVDVSYWQEVLDLYDAKKLKESSIALIKYANPKMFDTYGNAYKNYFEFPHGSIILKVNITDEKFSVEAPFLEVPSEKYIPLLRQIAQINFYPLNLSNINLIDNQLVFQYECPTETIEPYKLWDVFYEICIYADSYDDEFIKQFNAKRIYEPKIKYYSNEQIKELYSNLIKMIDEAKAFCNYFYSKRWDYFCWDIVAITLFKIDHHIAPQGNFRSELEKQVDYVMKSKDPHQQRVSSALEFFEKIKNTPADKIMQDIYSVENFISPKRRATHETLINTMKGTYDRAMDEYNKGDYIACTLSVEYIYYYILYYYTFEDKYFNEIHTAFKISSGKPWKEAASVLFSSFQKFISNNIQENTFVNEEKETKKNGGFFSKLFGK
jgi:hypothetical protein